MDKQHALYCPLRKNYNSSNFVQRITIENSNITSSNPDAGGATLMWIKLESLPDGKSAALLTHGGSLLDGSGASDNNYAISINTSNRLTVRFRRVGGNFRLFSSGVLTTNVWYSIIINYVTGIGVRLYINESLTSDANDVTSHRFNPVYDILGQREGASGTLDNFNGWLYNFQRFVGCGELSEADIKLLSNNGVPKHFEERFLPNSLKDTCVTSIRFNQGSGDRVKDTGIKRPKHAVPYHPIIWGYNQNLAGLRGAGRWVDVTPPPPSSIEDFEEVFSLGAYNAVTVNYKNYTPFTINDDELEVLREDYRHFTMNSHGHFRYRFSSGAATGSWIKGNVPLSDNMHLRVVYSTTTTSNGNIISLPDGQNDGLAIWYSSANRLSVSIFHSGGTNEQFNLDVGDAPNDGTLNTLDFLAYRTGGTTSLILMIDGIVELNTTTTHSIEGLGWQMGQFKNNPNNRLNNPSPTEEEGIHEVTMWKIHKPTQPSNAEVLALVPDPHPVSRIHKNEISGVTNIAGEVIYTPLAPPKFAIIFFHGQGDGRDNLLGGTNPLTHIASITIGRWLRQNDVEANVWIVQASAGTFNQTNIEAYHNYRYALTPELFDEKKVWLVGYSAGANGIDLLVGAQSAMLAFYRGLVPIAGNMNNYGNEAEFLLENGIYTMLFGATNDVVTSPGSVRTANALVYDLNPERTRITMFSELSDDHTEMQDLVYNNVGNSEPQETGVYTIGGNDYPFHEWRDTTWWNDVREVTFYMPPSWANNAYVMKFSAAIGDNTGVATLTDLMGNADATQATTGSRPLRSVSADLGSKLGLVFDGIDDWMLVNDLTLFRNVPGFTFACVAHVTANTTQQALFQIDASTGGALFILRLNPGSVSGVLQLGGRRTVAAGAGFKSFNYPGGFTTGLHAIIAEIDYVNQTIKITLDGVTESSAIVWDNGVGGGNTDDNDSTNPPTLGAVAAGVISNSLFSGAMGDVYIKKDALTTEEREELIELFYKKYGV